MNGSTLQRRLRILSLVTLILCTLATIWAWREGLFESEDALRAWVAQFGASGGVLFVLFQMVQVVVPIIPGGLGCLAGVILFGGLWGFVYNYLGICLGSLIAFGIARSCGRPLLSRLFPQKLLAKYDHWTGNQFTRLFALAIFFPVAPDDFLCYLAGTTRMSWQQFTIIIILGKPASIALYSMGLTAIWHSISHFLA